MLFDASPAFSIVVVLQVFCVMPASAPVLKANEEMGDRERFPCQLSQQCQSHRQPCWNRILVTLYIEKTYCCNFRVTLSCWVHLFGGLYRAKTLQGAEVMCAVVQCVVTCIPNTSTKCKWPRVEGVIVDCLGEKGAAFLQVVLRRLSLHCQKSRSSSYLQKVSVQSVYFLPLPQ